MAFLTVGWPVALPARLPKRKRSSPTSRPHTPPPHAPFRTGASWMGPAVCTGDGFQEACVAIGGLCISPGIAGAQL